MIQITVANDRQGEWTEEYDEKDAIVPEHVGRHSPDTAKLMPDEVLRWAERLIERYNDTIRDDLDLPRTLVKVTFDGVVLKETPSES